MMNYSRTSILMVVIVALLSLCQTLFAVDEAKVEEYTLENGLKVILYEMHSSPVIYSNLTYNIGSKYEPYGQTGISHVVEHMMFKGTKRFPKGTIADLISANGGVFNAYTSNDITVYYELLPKNKIDLALDIESERMYKCDFDPQEFTSELNVIMEERRMRTENSASGMRREEVNTLIYKSHPYRNPVIGWMEDLKQITREQAVNYYRTYYTPNNATLVLVGDFNSEEMLDKVNRYYGKIPAGPELSPVHFYRVEQSGRKYLEFRHHDILNKSIHMYFSVPSRSSEDGAALYVAGRILAGRSATSRLYKSLVRSEKLCESAAGGMRFSKDPSTFNIYASLLPDTEIDQVESIIWREIDSLARHPVLEYDLQKIKNQIEFNENTDDQTPDAVGSRIARYENYVGWRFYNKWQDMIRQVTREDIMRVVNQYLVNDNVVITYSYPEEPDSLSGMPSAEEIDDEYGTDEADLSAPEIDIAGAGEEKNSIFKKLFGKEEEDVRALYRPTLETIISPNPVAPLIDSLELDNGIKVYFIEAHDFPTLFIVGLTETGRLVENAENPGIREFTESMIQRGTSEKSFDEIVEEKSFTPYQFSIGQSWNSIVLQGYCLIEDADKMLDLAVSTLSEPSFEPEQMEKIRPRYIANAKKFKQTETMKAFYAMFEKVFEGHQYSLPYSGEVSVYENLTREDIVSFYDKYYSPDGMKLVAVGDFSEDWLYEKLNATLGTWQKPSGDEHVPFTTIKPIRGKHVYVFGNPEYKQCRVDIAFNPVEGGITTSNPDLDELDILEHILCGSSLTSRMGVKLRDEKGLCYNIKSNMWVRDHGGYWNIRTFVDKSNLSEMIRGIFNEIQLIQDEYVSDDELLKAKSRKLGLLPLYIRTADDIGVVVYDMIKEKRPFDYFDTRRQRILSVDKDDLLRVANTYLDTENYIIAVSGNISEDALDEFR